MNLKAVLNNPDISICDPVWRRLPTPTRRWHHANACPCNLSVSM
jgi:hypothetical protein